MSDVFFQLLQQIYLVLLQVMDAIDNLVNAHHFALLLIELLLSEVLQLCLVRDTTLKRIGYTTQYLVLLHDVLVVLEDVVLEAQCLQHIREVHLLLPFKSW